VPRGLQAARSEISTGKVLDAALDLFSTQGYGATSMRQIAEACEQSVGNLYHHFGSKEAIFQRLIDTYWKLVLDPGRQLQQTFESANFPDDLEDLAAAIEKSVEDFQPYIMLVFIDVIEFNGKHIRSFFETMAERFQEAYSASFEERKKDGRLGEVDPMVAVMVATRWLFYFFTVEKCFGVPMHFGMDTSQAVDEFIRIVRYGVLPREEANAGQRISA
jgi:AcrR family transcriptional regulator